MNLALLYNIKELLPDYRLSTLKNMFIILMAILQKETVCLYRLKSKIGSISGKTGSSPHAHYTRCIRFFNDHALSDLWLDILSCAMVLLRHKTEYLVLDGTSWQYGQRKLHYLTLSVVYKGISIPIFWVDLKKKGTSNSKERQQLFLKAMRRLNLKGKTVLMDREYIGIDWLKFLKKNGIDFVVRLKRGAYKKWVNEAGGKRYSALEHKISRSRSAGKTVFKDFELSGLKVRLVMAKNHKNSQKEPIIYLLSSLPTSAKHIIKQYRLRWSIETCFKNMKSSGFQLEKINLECPGKARLLVAIVVLAYTLSVIEGLKGYAKVKVKKYSNGNIYKEISAFRKGIERITLKYEDFKKFCRYVFREIFMKISAYRNPDAIFV